MFRKQRITREIYSLCYDTQLGVSASSRPSLWKVLTRRFLERLVREKRKKIWEWYKICHTLDIKMHTQNLLIYWCIGFSIRRKIIALLNALCLYVKGNKSTIYNNHIIKCYCWHAVIFEMSLLLIWGGAGLNGLSRHKQANSAWAQKLVHYVWSCWLLVIGRSV